MHTETGVIYASECADHASDATMRDIEIALAMRRIDLAHEDFTAAELAWFRSPVSL